MSFNNTMATLEKYQRKLERKERIMLDEKYLEEKNSLEGFRSLKREIEYNRLDAEINLLRNLVEELKGLSATSIF